MKYDELKKECFKANLELPRQGLVIYTFGNVSCIDRISGVYAIKPSGVEYGKMRWRDMVVIDMDGKIVDGGLKPSSDSRTHLVLYQNFPAAGSIVHTHSTYAAAWAQSLRDVPLYGTTHADHLPADIPCTELMPDERIVNDYEAETGMQIVDCFKKRGLRPEEIQMTLVAGHGPFTWAGNAAQAVYNARILEELCRMAFLTEQINPEATRLKKSLVEKHYNRKHGVNAYYGQK
ncbi:MAG: L-ribulose-5-phosphate 4-epimerase AraD [Victivallaceae bacterium]|jgi:L-ribulose-5-phosphate 4-epimerase